MRRALAALATAGALVFGGLVAAPAANAYTWTKCGFNGVCYKQCTPIEEFHGCNSGWYYRIYWYA